MTKGSVDNRRRRFLVFVEYPVRPTLRRLVGRQTFCCQPAHPFPRDPLSDPDSDKVRELERLDPDFTDHDTQF